MEKTIALLRPVAMVVKSQANELLERLETQSRNAGISTQQALDVLRQALAMPKGTPEEVEARADALEAALPQEEAEAFCMATEAINLIVLIDSFDRAILRQSFNELIFLRNQLDTVFNAYWEATGWAGPSWWKR